MWVGFCVCRRRRCGSRTGGRSGGRSTRQRWPPPRRSRTLRRSGSRALRTTKTRTTSTTSRWTRTPTTRKSHSCSRNTSPRAPRCCCTRPTRTAPNRAGSPNSAEVTWAYLNDRLVFTCGPERTVNMSEWTEMWIFKFNVFLLFIWV